MAVVGLPAVMLDMGVEQSIIRQKTPTPGVYNTAWTIRMCQTTLVSAIIFLAAPWVAEFYADDRLVPILQVLALAAIIRAAENIWVVRFLKSYSFKKDFYYNTGVKVLSVVVTVSYALYFQSYWALVFGQLSASVIRLLVSHAISPEFARPTFSQVRLIWSFSQWSLVKGLAHYIVRNCDRLVLGRFGGPEVVGVYTIGREVAEVTTTEIAQPINRALGPGFSALQQEADRLGDAVHAAVTAALTIMLPICVGLALTADDLVPTVFGADWVDMVPILQILAVASTLGCFKSLLNNMLTMVGYIRLVAIVTWLLALSVVATGLAGAIWMGAVGVAWAYLVSEALALAVMIWLIKRALPRVAKRLFTLTMLRPAAATLVMAAAVWTAALASGLDGLMGLMLQVGVGVVVYVGAVLALWVLSGQPNGLERRVFDRLSRMSRARVSG
jgi:O-antigen/teichoic acid export membrane protein